MVIGLGEAAITTLVVAAVARARPELMREPEPAARVPRYAAFAAYGLLTALGLVVFVAPFASGWPDGLAKVAESLGFAAREAQSARAPLPGYAVPGLGVSVTGTVLAGVTGTAVAFAAAWSLATLLTRRAGRPRAPAGDPGAPVAA